jgi:putative ABC transport system permease protein
MPRDFRREYEDEVCRVAEEQWRERADRMGWLGGTRFWAKQSWALVRAAADLGRPRPAATGGATMDGFIQDLRLAARGLARRPGFTALTMTTLALGIGATTAIFSAVRAVLLRPLPYRDAEEIVVLSKGDVSSGVGGSGVSAANIRDFREAATLFDHVAVAQPWSLDLQVEGRAESLPTWTVSRGFFDAIGARPLLGRTFTDVDYDEGAPSIVVLSHRAWSVRFGSDPGVLGRPIQLDGQALTVVGVLPPDFRFPDAAELWIPRVPQSWDEQSRSADYMTGVARLSDGVSREQAQAEASRIAASLREAHPRLNADLDFRVVPLREHLFGDVRAPLLVIMAAVGFVLLIACANVAGLMLSRGAQRGRDYALRAALGAGSGRLISHVSAESLVLASGGCVLGVALTYGGVRMISALGPDHLPRIDELAVDGAVLVFALLVGGVSALLSGLAPSLRFSRPDLRAALGDGARGGTGGRAQTRGRSRLVVVQVAAAVVLLFGAGLLLRSFAVLLDRELGFDPTDRVAVQVFAYGYPTPEARQVFVEQVVAKLEALPGVTGVALTTNLPGANDGTIANIEVNVPFTIEGRTPPPPGQEPIAALSQVSRGYFDFMDIEVVTGREFDGSDNASGRPVMIVNETLARRHFGASDPLGEHALVQGTGAPVPREIVGVVRDVRPLGHASDPRPEVYLPLAQVGSGSLTFVVRAASNGAALTTPAMEAVWSVNPAQSVGGAASLEAILSEWLKERRFNLFLLTCFSVVALALAGIGLYGLISFSVERRVGELGIRRALGGRSGDLLRMVMGEGARLAGAGLALGFAAAWYLSRFMRGMLFEVEPTDPLTFALLGVLVFVIAALATLLPALRAVRVDPVEALRRE